MTPRPPQHILPGPFGGSAPIHVQRVISRPLDQKGEKDRVMRNHHVRHRLPVRAVLWVAALQLAILGTVQAQATADLTDRLLAMTAITGYEQAMADSLLSVLPGAALDRAGNVVVVAGSGSPRRLAACPMDELGYVVGNIRADGWLTLRRVGRPANRLSDQFFARGRVNIWSRSGRLPGVVAVPSTHLTRGRPGQSTAPFTVDDAYVDVGASSRREVGELGIELLDAVATDKAPHYFGSGMVAAPAAGSRAACSALAHAVTGRTDVTGTVVVAFTVESRLGHRGLLTLAPTKGPFEQTVLLNYPLPRALPDEFGTVESWDIPTSYEETPVESIDLADIDQLRDRLVSWIGEAGQPGLPLGRVLRAPRTRQRSPKTFNGSVDQAAIERAADLLGQLVETYGVSGDEEPVRDLVMRALPAWARPQVDTAGNVWVRVGKGDPVVVFVAHLDETGFAVEEIRQDGTVTLTRRGGFLPWLWEATPALIHTPGGDIPGVFMPRDSSARLPSRIAPGGFRLDLGTGTQAATEALGIVPGLTITNPKRFVRLSGNRATGRSFDDRVGSAAQLLAVQQLDTSKLKHEVIFLWVTREEIGLVGSRVAARELGLVAARVYAIDTFVSADSPLDPQNFAVQPLGEGPVARAVDNSSVIPPAVLDTLRELARQNGVPLQLGTTNGGNDGSAFRGWGVVDIPIGWPLRYSHSPVEVIDLVDLVSLANLIAVIAVKW